jgi:hypothetical protein
MYFIKLFFGNYIPNNIERLKQGPNHREDFRFPDRSIRHWVYANF